MRVANTYLNLIVDESTAQQRQVTFVVFRKMSIEVVGDDDLEDRITEKLKTLIVAAKNVVPREK